MGVPRVLAVWRCGACGHVAERDAASSAPPPLCGSTTDETTSFPDGGWLRVQKHSSHGAMTLSDETRAGNPFQKQVDANADRLVAAAQARFDPALKEQWRCPTCGKNSADAKRAVSGLDGESMADRFCCLEHAAAIEVRIAMAGGVYG